MKIVLISDTHQQKVKNLPDGDLLIHTGDWSGRGDFQETMNFIAWMEEIRADYGKIVCVPGNHDRWVDKERQLAKDEFKSRDLELLIHEGTIHMGAHIWGHPMTPIFGNWAFMGNDQERKLAADQIPYDISILASHGPPLGYLDKLASNGSQPGMSVGCKHLAEAVLKVQPELHTFGHIHEGSGIMTLGKSLLVNASNMDEYYRLVNGFKVVYL